MKRAVELLSTTVLVIPALVGVALALTAVANRFHIMGLGWLALLGWILVAAAALVPMRRSLPWPMWIGAPLGWFVLAALLYQYAGCYCFGWTGLIKP